jgi:hypothetical protein
MIKKIFICLIFLAAIIFPLACGNQNNAPTGPIGGSAATATHTPVPSFTPTPGGPTNTPTPLPAGANTPTFTPTFAVPTPVYEHTIATFASPNGMVVNGGVMRLAEKEDTGSGYEGLEIFDLGNGGVTTNAVPQEVGALAQGIPTPGSTSPWQPTTITLVGPQGFINPGGDGPAGGGTAYFSPASSGNSAYAAVLDVAPGGAATLYTGNDYELGWQYFIPGYGYDYEPIQTNGYGALAFNNPKAMTGDGNGNIYITDTGNHVVEEFWGYDNAPDLPGPGGLHKTGGNAGITFVNNTAPAAPTTFVSVGFISPYGITVDSSNNVWVTDTGYSPSVVQEFSFSGSVSILAAWPTVTGCVATGIAVAPAGSSIAGDICVADSGNNEVEIYNPAGTLLTVLSDPHSAYEGGHPFAPSCIGFNGASSTYDLWVADTSNEYVISFVP